MALAYHRVISTESRDWPGPDCWKSSAEATAEHRLRDIRTALRRYWSIKLLSANEPAVHRSRRTTGNYDKRRLIEWVRAETTRATGRVYRVDFDALDAQSLRELHRTIGSWPLTFFGELRESAALEHEA
jgi:hypothetical protein